MAASRLFRLVVLATFGMAATGAIAAAPRSAPGNASAPAAAYEHLVEAARAVVSLRIKAIANARSNVTLGNERVGSGVYIAPQNLVLTIGYLILEADHVEVTTSTGRTVPAIVAAYDPATGFGLLRPLAPLDIKAIALGASGRVDALDRLLVASGATEDALSVATVVAKRQFAGYWEYLIDDAIFTAPPRADFGGAALINREGELVGIGSLLVMDAATPGERLPGNMFVPIDLLKPVLGEMVSTGRQKGGARPWLGINSREHEGRLHVIRVSADSPAERAGIEAGDIILQVGGKSVETLPEFYKRVWNAGAPGVEVTLKLLKGTEVQEVKVRTIDRFELIRKRPGI
ncbi:MAG TPA: S1C family serine protease [Usitatibacter sp.]|nr:S1C family serine protease [Usitatibacter sp.]